jgi:hypothetical protein
VALVGNQHSKWKVSDRQINRNIYLDTYLQPVKNQEEDGKIIRLSN